MSSDMNVIFEYNGKERIIQCNKSDKMRNIINKYKSEIELDNNKNYYYIYNNNKINEELKYEEIIKNNIDNKINKIIVKEEIKIICPICGENILIKIKDYRINLYKCKNYHEINNISIKELNNIINKTNNIYEDIIYNNENKELEEYIVKLENIIDNIINNLINIKENMRIYNNINNKIINNNNINNEILNEFINNNNKIILDIKEIINDNDINEQFKNIINIYNKINNINYIIAEIDIKENDVNKDIRIINSFEEYKREKEWKGEKEDEYKNEEEIKKCKIKINNTIIPSFTYFYKFNNIGKYKILYIFEGKLTKLDYMFYECSSLIYINLSNFNTQNVTDMSYMFSYCSSLKINIKR